MPPIIHKSSHFAFSSQGIRILRPPTQLPPASHLPEKMVKHRGEIMDLGRTALSRTGRSLIGCGIFMTLVSTGCHSKTSATPENFIQALNAHLLDKPECLMPDAPRFPFETSDPLKTKQLNTLVKSQLLTVQEEMSIKVSRYTPTTIGARVAPRFCYGHREVTSIDSFTPPAVTNGFPETHVVYHYELKDVPVWAKSDDVQKAYPEMAKAVSGPQTDQATLARTMAGWQVPE
jgi:hypothetical protein